MDEERGCKICGSKESELWWKCCPDHTTEQGEDVVCLRCVFKLHRNYFREGANISVDPDIESKPVTE